MLICWTLICKHRNKKLSKASRTAINVSLSLLLGITSEISGLSYLTSKTSAGFTTLISSVITFSGIEMVKEKFTEKIIGYIEELYFKTDLPIPENYTGFRNEFAYYFKNY